MALFKISKGSKANLPTTLTEGFCWYTYDDSKFYIDHKDENGVLVRKALNAEDAETLTGASLSTILNSTDIEIPTSKAVLDALDALKLELSNQDAVVLVESQQYTDAAIANIEISGGFSGSYNDLTDKPTIPTVPTNVSAFENDSNYVTESALESVIAGIPSESIIDVVELPTEGINTNVFYRVKDGEAYTLINGEKNTIVEVSEDGTTQTMPITLYTVDTLPAVGEAYVDNVESPTRCTFYLQTSDSMAYVYMPASITGSDADMWLSLTQSGMPWALITSPEDATEAGTLYIVSGSATYELYYYANGEWIEIPDKTKVEMAIQHAGYVSQEEMKEVLANIHIPSEAIIDCETLPNEDINAQSLYRLREGSIECYTYDYDSEIGDYWVKDSISGLPTTVHVVDVLPETGEAYGNFPSLSRWVIYLNTSDSKLYVYIDESAQSAMDYNLGWNSSDDIGAKWVLVNSTEEATDITKVYFVQSGGYSYKLYAYTNGEWVEYVTKVQLEEALAGVGGSGGTTEAIIDVTSLPTENINEKAFYRVLSGSFVINQYVQSTWICHCVDTLPEVGDVAVSGDLANQETWIITAYYNVADGGVYSYVDDMIGSIFGVPAGWYPFGVLAQAAGVEFSGVITNIMDDTLDDTFRLLLENVVWSYKVGKWTRHKTIGWAGDGNASEVFNLPVNKAYGHASHAEGRGTVAGIYGRSTYGQHAEGCETRARGGASHAEGNMSGAEGVASHAEGEETYAKGDSSHTEGFKTVANGYGSHTEGSNTIASSDWQHVQGKYNIEDNDNKYAHIVGNGVYADGTVTRSNAHTLDWDGNAWFAGEVFVGGTGQFDKNAERLVRQSELDEALANVGGVSSWNDLTDKPFYDESIHLDRNNKIEGQDGDLSIDNDNPSIWGTVSCVSNKTYSKEQLLGATVVHDYTEPFTGVEDFKTHTLNDTHVRANNSDYLYIRVGDGAYIFVAYVDNCEVPFSFGNALLPKRGTYLTRMYVMDAYGGVLSLTKDAIKKLDTKYIGIVEPAQGSRGNENFVESVAGLVKLYNHSAGLSIDEHGQLGIVAATESDINEGTSMRKPIVPKTMKYAMQQNSFSGNLNNITPTHSDAYTPAGALAIKDFLLQNLLNFKLYKIPRGEMFEIKPGMMGLVLPYGDYTLSVHESQTADAKISNMGATIIMATDWGADAEDAECYWAAFLSVKANTFLGQALPTMGSNHTKYTQNCYIKNNDAGTSGTGYAYVYYIERN